ncbi:MAG: hypothetical protein ABS882_11260, partial [Lysinibacillus sp.]
VKFEDKKLEDFPLYAYPDYKNDVMYLNGLPTATYNSNNNKILKDRESVIKVSSETKSPLNYKDGALEPNTAKILVGIMNRYGLSEAETYRLITYLYYTGNVYKGDKFTAYIVYPSKEGATPTLYISRGAI